MGRSGRAAALAVRRLGKTGLVYNAQPGGFWGPAVPGLWQLMQETAGLTVGDVEEFVDAHLPAMTIRTAAEGSVGTAKKAATANKDQDTGYGSESDTDADIDDDD